MPVAALAASETTRRGHEKSESRRLLCRERSTVPRCGRNERPRDVSAGAAAHRRWEPWRARGSPAPVRRFPRAALPARKREQPFATASTEANSDAFRPATSSRGQVPTRMYSCSGCANGRCTAWRPELAVPGGEIARTVFCERRESLRFQPTCPFPPDQRC